jgi:hypothetical protein
MLPDPNFAQSIQKATAGTEAQTLGAYFPSAAYMTAADFEKQGCPGFTASTAFGTQPGDLPGDGLAQNLPRAAAGVPWSTEPPGRGAGRGHRGSNRR